MMMMRRFCLALGMLLIATSLSHAQSGTTCSAFRISRDPQEAVNSSGCLDGPVFGFTFNEGSGQVNPILGIPGSLRLDNPLELGVRLDAAYFSDKHTYGLVVSSGDRRVFSLSFRDRTIYVRDVGVPPDPGKISLSSSGNVAALFYPMFRQILVVSQPGAALSWIADASVLSDDVVSLSISDDGARVLAGTAGGGVYSFTNDGAVQLIASMTMPNVIRFLRSSHDAVVGDRTEKRLYYYSESAGVPWSLVAEPEGVLSPVDLAVSGNNDRVFLVNENSENIIAIDLKTGQSVPVACNCLPRKLEGFQGSTLFEITNVTDSSLLLFQPAVTGGEILFVPTPADVSSAPADAGPASTAERPSTVIEGASQSSAPAGALRSSPGPVSRHLGR